MKLTALPTFRLSLLSALMVSQFAQAQDEIKLQPFRSQMVQGGTGLIQTPTSRMRQEGALAMNYTDNDQYRFWSVSMQLFPWMEATARYTDVRTQLYSPDPNFSGDQTLKDKGLDVKFRLWEESQYLPEISMGFRDFGGTGFFESEYVTMSKAYGYLDFHLGLGWGYMGTHSDFNNPFCEVSDRFCERPDGFEGRGGRVDYNQFFKGSMAVFGGVEYQTPWEPLKLMVEFEGNDYSNDRAGELEQKTRWNVGAIYRWKDVDFSLNYQRGNTIGFGVSYRLNMDTIRQAKFDPPKQDLAKAQRPVDLSEVDINELRTNLYNSAGFFPADHHVDDKKAIFYGTQLAYRDQDEAVDRIGRVLASGLPDSVETYHIVEASRNQPMVDTVIDADAFKRHTLHEVLEPNIQATYKRTDPSTTIENEYDPSINSGLVFSTDFFWSQSFGNPEDFFLYQAGLLVSSGYVVNPNFGLFGSLRVNLFDNLDKFNFTVDNEDSALPRVRTFVREYVTRTDLGVDTLYLNWSDKIAKDWYAQAYGGYLETMFGGVGGEVLYRPIDSNIAFGFDVNYVQQRSFEDDFSFRDYKAFTGHASVYWRPEWLPDVQLTLSAGQFLAKDKGVNIDFAKRFDSGIIVGAFAALTNVSSEEYGEGSFTKGFYVSIPFDLFVPKSAKGRGRIPWIPIARDGGQMLSRPVRLIDHTELRSPFYD